MSERETLIELLKKGQKAFDDFCDQKNGNCEICKYEPERPCGFSYLADYLLSNGVTVKECEENV